MKLVTSKKTTKNMGILESMEASNNGKSGTWFWTALGTAVLVGVAAYGVKKLLESHPQVKDSLDDLFGQCEDVVADLESRIGISQLAS